MLQLCPQCKGKGTVKKIAENIQYTVVNRECTMCKGTKLISQETGKPPKKEDKP